MQTAVLTVRREWP